MDCMNVAQDSKNTRDFMGMVMNFGVFLLMWEISGLAEKLSSERVLFYGAS